MQIHAECLLKMTRVLLFDHSSQLGVPFLFQSGISSRNRHPEQIPCDEWWQIYVWAVEIKPTSGEEEGGGRGGCLCHVPSCWEGSRRGHDGKVALGHVVGKTVPHRSTSGGTERGSTCDQIQSSERDARTDVLPAINNPANIVTDLLDINAQMLWHESLKGEDKPLPLLPRCLPFEARAHQHTSIHQLQIHSRFIVPLTSLQAHQPHQKHEPPSVQREKG